MTQYPDTSARFTYDGGHFSHRYVRQLTLPNSVTADTGEIWTVVCQKEYGYTTPAACQPAMWWYSGAIAAGNLALAPFDGTFGPIGKLIGIPGDYTKANTPYPLEGLPQTAKIGNITGIPVLYACGVKDAADLCSDRFRDETEALVADFTYLRVTECGHNLNLPSACTAYQTVIDAVVKNVESA